MHIYRLEKLIITGKIIDTACVIELYIPTWMQLYVAFLRDILDSVFSTGCFFFFPRCLTDHGSFIAQEIFL
jgi:hypothetical protein